MEKVLRPDWDQYFMSMAYMVAERSTCDRAHVGAILVKNKRVIGTGYNGAPSGMEHCDESGHLMHENHCIRTLHAEENTLLQAAKLGINADNSTIYTTHSPCYHCLKKIIATGIKRIVAGQMYRDNYFADTCRSVGIIYDLHIPDDNWLNHLTELYKNLPRKNEN